MAITATLTAQWRAGNAIEAAGALVFTGNYTTGGVAIDFGAAGVRSASPPIFVDISTFKGYSFQYTNGTNISNGLILVHLTSTGAELAAGAFPAALTGGGCSWQGGFKFAQ